MWRVEGKATDVVDVIQWGDLQGAPPARLGDDDPVSAAKAAADMLLGDIAVPLPATFALTGDDTSVTVVMRTVRKA